MRYFFEKYIFIMNCLSSQYNKNSYRMDFSFSNMLCDIY